MTRRHAIGALAGGVAIPSLGLGLGLVSSACGGSTTGELVRLDVSLRSDVAGGTSFENAHGWTIELSRIRVAIAALHLFEDHGAAEAEQASLLESGRELLSALAPIRSAHAHAGHVAAAEIRGEMVVPAVVDLAEGVWSLGEGAGTAGAVGSGHVAFDAALGDGWAVVLEGQGVRGGERRRFRARAAPAELISWHGDPEIWGCPVDRASVDSDGALELVASPTLWLDDVDLAMLPDVDEPVDLDPLLGMQDSFVAALVDPNGWRFHVA